jgi:hypothetical protein
MLIMGLKDQETSAILGKFLPRSSEKYKLDPDFESTQGSQSNGQTLRWQE